MYSIYFLKSVSNGRVYVGYTEKDPKERLQEHLSGSNQWTSRNGPFELMYFESYHCKTDALLREAFYKTGFGRRIRDAILGAVSTKDGSGG